MKDKQISNSNLCIALHGNPSSIIISTIWTSALDAIPQVKSEGVAALYAGLSAALARQASYTTLRLGLYDLMKRVAIAGECERYI